MRKFDFLNEIGNSKDDYEFINVDNDTKDKVEYLEILISRNLIQEDFKNELLNYYLNKKITEKQFFENIQKSIRILEKAEFKILSLDEEMFKLKNDKKEYVGCINKMPNVKNQLLPDTGKLSYLFAKHLYDHFKNRILTLKEINALSDLLEIKLFKIFNVEQTKIPEE